MDKNDDELIYFGVSGWNLGEIETIYPWINAYTNLLNDKRKAHDCLKNALLIEYGAPVTDINQCIGMAIKLIFYELAAIIKQDDAYHDNAKLKTKLKQLKKSFTPNINFAASGFGNCFDQIEFQHERKAIISQAIALLKN